MSIPFETRRIEIPIHSETVVGLLRVPEGAGPWATLVFLGPLSSVKEQVPGCYADAMARRGFSTLAIDNRHFGESSGQPRQYEHPGRKVEDIRAALRVLAEQPGVDATRFGAVGICAGAGYMAGVAAQDKRVRAFGAVGGFFHDPDKQREWMGADFDQAIERARQARAVYEATGRSEAIPAVGEGDVAMHLPEALSYYGTARGAHPNYVNACAVMSREHTLLWSAREFAARITVPTLMIHSQQALAPALARSFFATLAGPKRDVWHAHAAHTDFYDNPEVIEPAADQLADFFQTHLG